MKLEKNNFVVTFKTEKEVVEYFKMHIPESSVYCGWASS